MAGQITAIQSKESSRIKAQPQKEYVSGGTLIYGDDSLKRVLPRSIDEIERELGDRVYDRMATDPDVAAGLDYLKLATLAEIGDKIPALSAIEDETDVNFELAREIAEFCERATERVPKLRQAFDQLLEEALSHGNKLAETIFEYPANGVDVGKLTLKDIKPKPRTMYGYVVDAKMNVLGVAYVKPGASIMQGGLYITDEEELLPREKFVILTPLPMNNDPRGRSFIRSAYNAWWLKHQTFPEFLRFLLQCALPSFFGFLPEEVEDVELIDDETGEAVLDEAGDAQTIPANVDMLRALVGIRNAAAAVFQHGSEVQQVEVKSDGEAFHKAFVYFGKQITLAILKQELATRDSQHQTKNATGSQQDILDLVIVWLKGILTATIRYDIYKPLIAMNYGDEAADQFLPRPALSEVERGDWAEDAAAADKLAKHLTDSQWQQILDWLGIKRPEDGEEYPKRGASAPLQPQLDADGNPIEDDATEPKKEELETVVAALVRKYRAEVKKK